MKCSDERLSAWLDDDLDAAEAARLEEHLRGCPRCQAARSELERLRAILPSLPEVDPAPPDGVAEGFTRLMSRMGGAPPAPRPFWRRPLLWLAPAFAAAALAVVPWLVRRAPPTDVELVAEAEREFRDAADHYRRAIEKLRRATEGRRARLDPEERVAHEAARAALEAATEQCRLAAQARPSDPEAEELLFAAYRSQIAFYQELLLRTDVPKEPHF